MATITKPLVLDETMQEIKTVLQSKTFDIPILQDKTITTNGTYSADSGYDGLDKVTVNVSGGGTYQEKTATVNGEVTADTGYDALSKVTVNVPNGTETTNITANGTYTPTAPNIGFSSVTVNVPAGGNYQEKTVTENGEVTPDEGYDALSKVTVNVSGGEGDVTIPYVTAPVTLDGTETTEFRAHPSSLSCWGSETWIPGTSDDGIIEMWAVIDGVHYSKVTVGIQESWTGSDFDEYGNAIFRLSGKYKAYNDDGTLAKEGTDFSMRWVYDELKYQQSTSEQPSEPFIQGVPASWICSGQVGYHFGEQVEGMPTIWVEELHVYIYFKVN